MKLSVLSSSQQQFWFTWLLQCILSSSFANWMSQIPSSMVLSLKRFLWNNLVVLFMPSIQTMCFVSTMLSICGLKQAPSAWYTRLRHSLVHLGFIESLIDASLFTFHHSDIHLYVFYVANILVTDTHSSHVSISIWTHQQAFSLKDLGALSYFLGIHVVHTSQGLHLSQSNYFTELLHRALMVGAKPCSTTTTFSSKLSLHDGASLSLRPLNIAKL